MITAQILVSLIYAVIFKAKKIFSHDFMACVYAFLLNPTAQQFNFRTYAVIERKCLREVTARPHQNLCCAVIFAKSLKFNRRQIVYVQTNAPLLYASSNILFNSPAASIKYCAKLSCTAAGCCLVFTS